MHKHIIKNNHHFYLAILSKRLVQICFFLYFSIFVSSQIYVSENSTIYVEEGASIFEIKDYTAPTEKKSKQPGKIFVSKETVLFIKEHTISVQIVFIDTPKRTVENPDKYIAVVKQKKLRPKKDYVQVVRSDAKFHSSSQKDLFYLKISHFGNYITSSNTNFNIKAVLIGVLDSYCEKRFVTVPRYFYTKSNHDKKDCVNSFSIRPPPVT